MKVLGIAIVLIAMMLLGGALVSADQYDSGYYEEEVSWTPTPTATPTRDEILDEICALRVECTEVLNLVDELCALGGQCYSDRQRNKIKYMLPFELGRLKSHIEYYHGEYLAEHRGKNP